MQTTPRRLPRLEHCKEQAHKARLLPCQQQTAALLRWVAACAGDISLCASQSKQMLMHGISAECPLGKQDQCTASRKGCTVHF